MSNKNKPVADATVSVAVPVDVKTVTAKPAPAPRSRKKTVAAPEKIDVVLATPVVEKAEVVIEAKPAKIKKVKMVRDSFTMPQHDYERLSELKKKCLKAGVAVKKSELLRAGLISLSSLSDKELINAVNQLEKIKTGRPAKV